MPGSAGHLGERDYDHDHDHDHGTAAFLRQRLPGSGQTYRMSHPRTRVPRGRRRRDRFRALSRVHVSVILFSIFRFSADRISRTASDRWSSRVTLYSINNICNCFRAFRRCGADGKMKCDPKPCSPEPLLRKIMAEAVDQRKKR